MPLLAAKCGCVAEAALSLRVNQVQRAKGGLLEREADLGPPVAVDITPRTHSQ